VVVNTVFDFVQADGVPEAALASENDRLDARQARLFGTDDFVDLDDMGAVTVRDAEAVRLYDAVAEESGDHVYLPRKDFHCE